MALEVRYGDRVVDGWRQAANDEALIQPREKETWPASSRYLSTVMGAYASR